MKAKVSFSSNFESTFSAIKHDSSVLFQLKHYIFWSKAAHQSANFWNFRVVRSKFIKVPMSFLKRQVNSSFNLASFFIFMTNSSPVNLKIVNFQLWTNESYQSHNFETFKCCGEDFPNSLSHFWKQKFSFKFCINIQCHQTQLPYTFLAQKLYTLVKGSQLKCKCLRFLSARIKIRRTPQVDFELTNQFLFNFGIILHCHDA